MALPLRGIGASVAEATAIVEAKIARGEYQSLVAGPERRRFVQTQPLNGRRWQFNTPDQQPIKVISLNHSDHCAWCRRPVIEAENVDLPVRLIRKNTATGQEIYIIGTGTHCSFECVAAILQRENGFVATMRPPAHLQSWELLHLLYSWVHPGKKLTPAPDYTIMDTNSTKAIEAARSVFVPLNGLINVHVPLSYHMIPA